MIVDFDLIEFSGWLVKLRGPGLASVMGNIGATIIGLYVKVGIIRVDPHVMVVTMGRGESLPVFTTVFRNEVAR